MITQVDGPYYSSFLNYVHIDNSKVTPKTDWVGMLLSCTGLAVIESV